MADRVARKHSWRRSTPPVFSGMHHVVSKCHFGDWLTIDWLVGWHYSGRTYWLGRNLPLIQQCVVRTSSSQKVNVGVHLIYSSRCTRRAELWQGEAAPGGGINSEAMGFNCMWNTAEGRDLLRVFEPRKHYRITSASAHNYENEEFSDGHLSSAQAPCLGNVDSKKGGNHFCEWLAPGGILDYMPLS